MSFPKSLIARIQSLGLAYQVHLLAFVILFLSIGLAWMIPTAKGAQQTLKLIASFGFAIGFSVWCWPVVTWVWAHPIGKAFIAVLHLFVLLLATVFARFIVASSLGLPPQDFDLTVSFVSIALYIPAWSIVVSIILGLVAIILEFIGMLSLFANRPFGSTVKFFAHMGGALAICFISASIYNFATKNEKSLYPLVKWVAFFGDFQPTPKYPGVGDGERIRLHENGVISVAQIQNGEIQILVRKYE